MGLTALVDRHSELVGRMTETLDIDLVAAAQSGAMPEEALRSVVYACTGCSQAGACGEWLDAHEGGADSAPGHLSAQAPARMMVACHGCAFPEVCTVWLSECRGPNLQAPDFCANKGVLDRLAGEVR